MFLPGEFHGQRNLVLCYSSWGHKVLHLNSSRCLYPLRELGGRDENSELLFVWLYFKKLFWGDFLSGSVVKNPPANAGDMVWSLIQEDPTYCGATKSRSHNYWVHVSQLLKPVHPRACALQEEKLSQWEAQALQLGNSLHSLQLEKSLCSKEDLAWPKLNP